MDVRAALGFRFRLPALASGVRLRAGCLPLHFVHRERAGTGAARTSGQSPIAGDGIPVHRPCKRQRIARGRYGLHIHAKLAAYVATHVSAQREGSTFGLGREARRVVGETETRNGQRSVAVGRYRSAEGQDWSISAADQAGVPRSVNIRCFRVVVRTAPGQCQADDKDR